MTARGPQQTKWRLVRFWILFWPLLIVGGLALWLFSAAFVSVIVIVTGAGARPGDWSAVVDWFADRSVEASVFPLLIVTAILAGRFSGHGGFSLGAANSTGVIAGVLTMLLAGGGILLALIGAGLGAATCFAMWLVGSWTSNRLPAALLDGGTPDGQ